MNSGTLKTITLFLSILFCAELLVAQDKGEQFIYGDKLPDAPELSARGQYKVGVRTIEVVNKDQIDILRYKEDSTARYDRPLKLEVWYPAELGPNDQELVEYEEVIGNANTPGRPISPFSFLGRASRDAKPLSSDRPYPLLIVSHGYTGSRLLLSYLTENLASKGYVVVSIDHTESTYRDANQFYSTLLNRSLDVLFVLNEMDNFSKDKSSFLGGLLDADQTAILGYSMGGYGVLNVSGAGYSPQAQQMFKAMTGGSNALQIRAKGNSGYESSIDSRIKAVVAFAPWGMQRGVWNGEGLAGLKIPSLFVAGSEDDISGYEDGIKAIFDGAVNSDRYMLTYLLARHNVAPNPPPPEALKEGLHIDEYLRYADSVWDMRRINNVNQHFVTAFLEVYLRNNEEYAPYLSIKKNSLEEDWKGFKPRTSIGMEMHRKKVGE